MLRPFEKGIGTAIVVASVVAMAPSASAQNLLDWKATSAGTMNSGTPFTMTNVSDKETLKYGKRTWGINLVWDKNQSLNNITVERSAGAGPVLYGEPVAVKVNGGGWLKYEKRPVGINLAWSSTPVYEWRIGGGTQGQPVSMGAPFALLNDVEHDALIYGSRSAGINLVWLKDYGKTALDRAIGRVIGYGKDYLKGYF